MFKARALAAAIVAALFTALTFAALSWGVAEAAARGLNAAKLPSLLTLGNFSALEWPYRVGGVSLGVHLSFYVGLLLIALVAALITLVVVSKASPRHGSSAFFGTWMGVIIGAALAGAALYFWRVGDNVNSAAGRNDYLVETVKGMTFGGLIVGWFPAIFSWAAFKIANRKGAAALNEAQLRAEELTDTENPFDFTPGSISQARPVEPGFTYPSGDEFDDSRSYDAYATTPAKRSDESAEFTADSTDVTGEHDGMQESFYSDSRPQVQSSEEQLAYGRESKTEVKKSA